MNETSSPPASLIGSQGQDLTQHTQADVAEEIAGLRYILKGNPLPSPSLVVYERSVIMLLFFVLIAVGVGYGLYSVSVGSLSASPGALTFWAVVLIGVAVGLYRFVYQAIRHWNTPIMTLSLQGVQLRGVEHPVAWLATEGYAVVTGNAFTLSNAIHFFLDADHDLQWPRRQPSRYLRYLKKKNEIILMVFGINPSVEIVAEHIEAYRINALGRARLAELGEQA